MNILSLSQQDAYIVVSKIRSGAMECQGGSWWRKGFVLKILHTSTRFLLKLYGVKKSHLIFWVLLKFRCGRTLTMCVYYSA